MLDMHAVYSVTLNTGKNKQGERNDDENIDENTSKWEKKK